MSDKDNLKVDYSEHYSEENLKSKLTKYAIKAGRVCVEKALQLYLAFHSPETPEWVKELVKDAIISVGKKGKIKPPETPIQAKVAIISALGYFIFPVDVFLDFLPGGYLDDYVFLLSTIATVNRYITDDMKDIAKLTTDELFYKLFGEDNKEVKRAKTVGKTTISVMAIADLVAKGTHTETEIVDRVYDEVKDKGVEKRTVRTQLSRGFKGDEKNEFGFIIVCDPETKTLSFNTNRPVKRKSVWDILKCLRRLYPMFDKGDVDGGDWELYI